MPLCSEKSGEEVFTSHFLLSFLQRILATPNPVKRRPARNKFRFLPSLPPASPLLPPSNFSNPFLLQRWNLWSSLKYCLQGCGVVGGVDLTARPICRVEASRRNGPWRHIARDRPWQSSEFKETRNIKEINGKMNKLIIDKKLAAILPPTYLGKETKNV